MVNFLSVFYAVPVTKEAPSLTPPFSAANPRVRRTDRKILDGELQGARQKKEVFAATKGDKNPPIGTLSSHAHVICLADILAGHHHASAAAQVRSDAG
jgi:hypothetical protein